MESEIPIQSTSGAMARPANGVIEPVSEIVRKSLPVRRTLSLTVYCKTRQDAIITFIDEVIQELGAERAVRLRIRSWAFWWFVPLLKGASHPPVLEIDGGVYSEGIVPDKEQLKRHIQSLLV